MSFIQKVKILKQNYCNGDFVILSFSPIGESNPQLRLSDYFTASLKGNINFLSVNKEYTMELEEISNNPKWGSTYKIISIPSLTALDLDTLTLEQSKEILLDCTSSERIADNILSVYPDYIKKVLTEGKDSIDTKPIKGVGSAYHNAYCRILTDKYKYLHILQEYKQYDIDITDCKVLFDSFHDDPTIMKEFDERPYRTLINCLGRSFYKTDRLLMDIREELSDSNERCEFMILDVLDRNEQDGSSKINAQTLFTVASEDYNSPQLLPLLKVVAQESDLIYYKEDTNELAKMSTYNGECLIASFIKEKLYTSKEDAWNIDWKKYTKVNDFQMTETQGLALKNLCEYKISILAGFSGSGKTTSVKGIISLLEDNGKDYTLLSSTGKASRVLSESTGRKSSTIHRRCYSGTIDSDCVVCDEMSMVSIDVMCMLINAMENPKTHVVLVGDFAQASSIGVGKVFTDLIESKVVPTTTLSEIFRYKSDGSLFVATNIRQGKSFLEDKDMVKCENNVYTVGKNYKFIDTEDIFGVAISEYMKLIGKGIKSLDILGLTPMNKGDYGTYKLNSAIQAEVNPPKPNEKVMTRKIDDNEIIFRVGDCVINTKNDYNAVSQEAYNQMKEDSILSEEDVADTMIMNGQCGVIRQIVENGILIQFDEEIIYFSKKKIYNLLLSYFVTIHKSQGSTVEHSIEIISDKHKRMLTRSLLYVGATRNKSTHVEIGDIDTFDEALRINDNDLRKTWLKELLLDNPQ